MHLLKEEDISPSRNNVTTYPKGHTSPNATMKNLYADTMLNSSDLGHLKVCCAKGRVGQLAHPEVEVRRGGININT
jgi:hypothetical protein